MRIRIPIIILMICLASLAFAMDVKLQWTHSSSPNVVGYKIYYGPSSRTYSTIVSIPYLNEYTLTGLPNQMLFFSVTAIDSVQNESGFSNEVNKGPAAFSKCDINQDGNTNSVDLQMEVNSVLQGSSLGDLNKDGVSNALDLQIMSNVILGISNCPE